MEEKATAQMNELNQIFVNTVRGTGGHNVEIFLVVSTLLNSVKYHFLNVFELQIDTVSDRIVIEVHTFLKSLVRILKMFFHY